MLVVIQFIKLRFFFNSHYIHFLSPSFTDWRMKTGFFFYILKEHWFGLVFNPLINDQLSTIDDDMNKNWKACLMYDIHSMAWRYYLMMFFEHVHNTECICVCLNGFEWTIIPGFLAEKKEACLFFYLFDFGLKSVGNVLK